MVLTGLVLKFAIFGVVLDGLVLNPNINNRMNVDSIPRNDKHWDAGTIGT